MKDRNLSLVSCSSKQAEASVVWMLMLLVDVV